MTDTIKYIPFQNVKDLNVGDRIVVDGNPGKVRDIVEFKDPLGTEETIASIGVVYDDEPGVIRLVEFDLYQVKLERGHHLVNLS